MTTSAPLRAASVLAWIDAVGLGLPCVLAIWSVSTGRGVPLVLGYPAYGGGPSSPTGSGPRSRCCPPSWPIAC
jgi:hypothetical protein